jgi:RecA-family ATPase
MLDGDVVLMPFKDREPDWDRCTRQSLTWFSGHYSELNPEDTPRLAILTDGFHRYLKNVEGVSVVTLIRDGTPIVHQVDGEPCAAALDLIVDAVIDCEPLKALPQAANDNEPTAEPEEKEPLVFINPAEWHGKAIPTRQWYCEGLVPLRQVTILSGDGGVGKSLLALQIAAAGAMGLDTLETKPLPGKTLYIGAEDEAEEFHRRLAEIAKACGKDLDALPLFRLLCLADVDALLVVPDKHGNMKGTPLLAKIFEYATAFQPRLIVFDTAADLFGGDEIKRNQVRQFIAALRQIAIGLDCAIILLAHPSVQGIQTGTGSSGSTAWNNSVRSRLYLTRPDDKNGDTDARVLKTMKSNYGTVGGELRMRWSDGSFVLDDGKPAVASALLAAKAERIFLNLLSMLNRQGRNVCHVPGTTYAPAVMAKLPEADGASKARLAEAMNKLLTAGDVKIVTEGPPSRQRQRLILASEDFGPDDGE